MDSTKIVIIGDAKGIEEACSSIRYKELITDIIEWTSDTFVEKDAECLKFTSMDVIIVSFKDQIYFIDDVIKFVKSLSSSENLTVLDYYAMKKYEVGNMMLADIVMESIGEDEHFDGCILGLSHAELAIIEDRLHLGRFANLAVSGQDLWSNDKILQYCADRHGSKLMGMKYAIIDMFDYSYFNYDLSKANGYVNYIYRGGYCLDPHNFRDNKNFDISFEQVLEEVNKVRKEGVTDNQIKVWRMIGECRHDLNAPQYNHRNAIFRNNVMDNIGDAHIGAYTKKEYAETIKENTYCFRHILETLNSVSPGIRVLLLTIPRCIEMAPLEEDMVSKWKEPFYKTIEAVGQDYDFEYADFRNSDIPLQHEWYKDPSHFNCYGAMKFTDIVRDLLLHDYENIKK